MIPVSAHPLHKTPLVVPLAGLTPGTLLRYFSQGAVRNDGTMLDLDFLGIVVWHRLPTKHDKRRLVAVVWDQSASETYRVYDNDLNGKVISVVQTSQERGKLHT